MSVLAQKIGWGKWCYTAIRFLPSTWVNAILIQGTFDKFRLLVLPRAMPKKYVVIFLKPI